MNTKFKRRIHKGKKKMWNLTESDARATSKRSQTSIFFLLIIIQLFSFQHSRPRRRRKTFPWIHYAWPDFFSLAETKSSSFMARNDALRQSSSCLLSENRKSSATRGNCLSRTRSRTKIPGIRRHNSLEMIIFACLIRKSCLKIESRISGVWGLFGGKVTSRMATKDFNASQKLV